MIVWFSVGRQEKKRREMLRLKPSAWLSGKVH